MIIFNINYFIYERRLNINLLLNENKLFFERNLDNKLSNIQI